MTERLSGEAVLIDGGEPEHDGLVVREDAFAVGSHFWDW